MYLPPKVELFSKATEDIMNQELLTESDEGEENDNQVLVEDLLEGLL